jgi:glycosyltransferase involved in cell wall biosynthesis
MERAAIRLAQALLPDWDVQVIALSGGVDRIPSVLVARVRSMDVPVRFYRLPLAAWRLRRMFRSLPQDSVVIAVGLWAALPALHAARKAPIIVWEHSLLPGRVAHDARIKVLMRIVVRLYQRAASIVAVSEPVREFVCSFVSSSKVVCIPNFVEGGAGIREGELRPESSSRVAVVGNLHRIKNVGLALRALIHLPEEVTMCIVGDGGERQALETEVRTLGLGQRVEFAGHVDDVGAWVRSAAVVAHPAWSESFGYSLIEAAALRTPVVALDRPNMNRLIPEYVPGILVEDVTPNSFADAIADALEREWPDEVFEAAERARVAKFDSESLTDSWNALLRSVRV